MRTAQSMVMMSEGIAGPNEIGVVERDADGLPALIRVAVKGKPIVAVDDPTLQIVCDSPEAVVALWRERGSLQLPIDINHASHETYDTTSGATGWMVPEVVQNSLCARIVKWEELGKQCLLGRTPDGAPAPRFLYFSPTWGYTSINAKKQAVIGLLYSLALTNTPRTLGIKPIMPMAESVNGGAAMPVSLDIPEALLAALPSGGMVCGFYNGQMLFTQGDALMSLVADGQPVPVTIEPVEAVAAGAAMSEQVKRLRIQSETQGAALKQMQAQFSEAKQQLATYQTRDLVARVEGLALRGVPVAMIDAIKGKASSHYSEALTQVEVLEQLPKLPEVKPSGKPPAEGSGNPTSKQQWSEWSREQQDAWLDHTGAGKAQSILAALK